jgi:hypothetical protein
VSSGVLLAALRRADHSSKEPYRLCKKITELIKRLPEWPGRATGKKVKTKKGRQQIMKILMGASKFWGFPSDKMARA